MFEGLHKRRRRYTESFCQRTHLPNVEFALASANFRHYALTADFGQLALFDAALIHQKPERLHASCCGQ